MLTVSSLQVAHPPCPPAKKVGGKRVKNGRTFSKKKNTLRPGLIDCLNLYTSIQESTHDELQREKALLVLQKSGHDEEVNERQSKSSNNLVKDSVKFSKKKQSPRGGAGF